MISKQAQHYHSYVRRMDGAGHMEKGDGCPLVYLMDSHHLASMPSYGKGTSYWVDSGEHLLWRRDILDLIPVP